MSKSCFGAFKTAGHYSWIMESLLVFDEM